MMDNKGGGGPLEQLYRALLALSGPEDCAAFFEDLCTYQELAEMARRLEVARLLRQGLNYQRIAAETGVSTATISRVNRALRYGAGGYRLVLERLEKAEQAAKNGSRPAGRRQGGAGRPDSPPEGRDGRG